MRYFLNHVEITEYQARWFEAEGTAKVSYGSSGPVPEILGGPKTPDEPMGWMQLKNT